MKITDYQPDDMTQNDVLVFEKVTPPPGTATPTITRKTTLQSVGSAIKSILGLVSRSDLNISANADADTIAQRTSSGAVKVAFAANTDEAPHLQQVADMIEAGGGGGGGGTGTAETIPMSLTDPTKISERFSQVEDEIDDKVSKAGDTITGNLFIEKDIPVIVLGNDGAYPRLSVYRDADSSYITDILNESGSPSAGVIFNSAAASIKDKILANINNIRYSIFHEGYTGIQSGGNTNGFWMKWPDGTMMCTKQISWTGQITLTTGAIFYVDIPESDTGNFAQHFLGAPFNVQVTLSTGTASAIWIGVLKNTTDLEVGRITLLSTTIRDPTLYTINIEAWGRWA